ncbi:Ig-like domain-containing protein [Rapidithrix thailandica]|uniref:Ig-like domain-containing protein n=1 Tax=Rapidithrix thailandica TaxID=413964 RepID=A0AAW9S8S5_9BACT
MSKNTAFIRIVILVLLLKSTFLAAQHSFTEKAATQGVDLDGKKEGGFSFGDLNNDGNLDLIVNTFQDDASHRTRVYFSTGAPDWQFTDVTATHCKGCVAGNLPGVSVMERSLVIADFNHDGYKDFIRNSNQRLEVYFNTGKDGSPAYSFGIGTDQKPNFVLYTSNTQDTNPPNGIPNGMNTEGIGVLDYDNDGDLDLLIENHNWGVEIYENQGFATGNFVHVNPAVIGLIDQAIDGDYAAVADYNDDGLIDFITRKKGAIDLMQNDPNNPGHFIKGVEIGETDNLNKGSAAFYDFDNDGDFDLVWTASDKTQIFENQNGSFTPLGESTGIPVNIGNQIDALAGGDVDNDGDIDLFLADDQGSSFLYINQLNDPVQGPNAGQAMTFVKDNRGINIQGDAEGCVFVDFDQDGDLDLYLNIDGGKNQLWVNDLHQSEYGENYVMVDVWEERGISGNPGAHPKRYAVGATVRLKTCEGEYVTPLKEVNGGTGHGTQDPQRLHFGLPLGPDVEYLVEVKYPNYVGSRQVATALVKPSETRVVEITPASYYHAVNSAPEANDDVIEFCEGNSISFNVLDNDADVNNDPIFISLPLLQEPRFGEVEVNSSTGEITYTLKDKDIRPVVDTIQYQILDDPKCLTEAKSDVAWVIIKCEQQCDEVVVEAKDDAYEVTQCGTLADFTGNMFENDDLTPGVIYKVEIVEYPKKGRVTIDQEGNFNYTSSVNFEGEDRFTYRVCMDNGICEVKCSEASVVLTCGDGDGSCPPVKAQDDDYSSENCSLPLILEGNVTENDEVPEGTVTLEVLDEVDFGVLTFNEETGEFKYVANTTFSGTDQFTYKVCVEKEGCDISCSVATVTLRCDDGGGEPCDQEAIAEDDLFEQEGCSLPFVIEGNILTNDAIPLGQISITIQQAPANGTVALDETTGTFRYEANPTFGGEDSFTYEVCVVRDGCVTSCSTATVTLRCDDGGGEPCPEVQTEDDLFESQNCVMPAIFEGNVFDNDVIPLGEVSIRVVKGPDFGGLVLHGDGTFRYEADNGFTDEDSFTYEVCVERDGCEETCAQATVVLRCNDDGTEPCEEVTATDDYFQHTGCVLPFEMELDVMANDEIPEGELSIRILPDQGPNFGTLTFNAHKKFIYIPGTSFEGFDSFTYEVCVNIEGCEVSCSTATVTITCKDDTGEPCEEEFTALDDEYTAACGAPLEGINPLNNDLPEGATGTLVLTVKEEPVHGQFIDNQDGTFTYVPEEGYGGTDQLVYTACWDGCEEGCQDATVTFIVETGSKPVAKPDFYTTDWLTPISGDLSENDENPESLTYQTEPIEAPANGSVEILENGQFIYTPKRGFEGTDRFIYQVCNTCDCENVEVEIQVEEVPLIIYDLITPNDDTKNDSWVIDGIERFPNNKVQIFNRWGNLIYEVNGYNNESVVWRGQVNRNGGIAPGEELVPDGTYFYILELGGGQGKYNGTIKVAR